MSGEPIELPKRVEQTKLESFDISALPLNWVRLTRTDSSTIIYNTCDGGNKLLKIQPRDSSFLLHDQQEDLAYKYETFGIAYGVVHFVITEMKSS